MEKSPKGKCREKRSFICSHTGCKIYITSPSPKTKFCKKHRQVVYKQNYLNRNLKLRAKYQASRTCFSGSSDPFDGQDLDDMLHQVLVQKRLALMQSPSIVEFFQLRQNEIKRQSECQAAEELKKLNAGTEFFEKDINSNLLFATQDEGTQSSKPKSIDEGEDYSNESTYLMEPSVHSPVNVSSTINMRNSSSLSKVKCIGSKRKNLMHTEGNNLPNFRVLPKIMPNKAPGNLTNHQFERKSAFQETGAGDVSSLLAVRTVTQEQ